MKMNPIISLAADFGDWLTRMSKNKTNAIILVILSIISPLGFLFATCMIANNYRKNKGKK